MHANEVVRQVGLDIESFTLEDLKEAVNKLKEDDIYSDAILSAINSGDKSEIGGTLFMWLCEYLEREILGTDEKIEF